MTRRLARYVPDLAKDKFHSGSPSGTGFRMSLLGRRVCWLSAECRSCVGHLPAHRIGLHCTWLVNSATHMWGRGASRPAIYSTQHLVGRAPDLWRRLAQQSPRPSAFGAPRPRWYEVDINWYGIWALKKLGLARHIYTGETVQLQINRKSPTFPGSPRCRLQFRLQ